MKRRLSAEGAFRAAGDDIIDAAVCALTAALYGHALTSLPRVPPADGAGLPMEMVYPDIADGS